MELRQLFDLPPHNVTVLGPDRSRLFSETSPNINQAALDYHGLTLEEWRSSDPRTFFHPDDWERMTSEGQDRFLSGSSHETEARLLRSDGKYRWFLFRFNPLRDEQGRIMRWYVAATDIEDRRQAEAALREQANLLNLTHDSIFVRDMYDVITYWNRAAEDLYGWTPEEAVGKVTHQLLHTIFPAPIDEIRAELLRTGR